MDEIVKKGMAKWPNVPSVFGWLALDRRGRWLIKGERIANTIVADFIGRNYEHDEQGRWFFQNGPQRVFIALDYTPFIYRLLWDPLPGAFQGIETHTARTVTQIAGAWIDDAGIVLIESEHGVGLIDDRDLERMLASFTTGRGDALPEERVAAAIEQLQSGVSADLGFCYRGETVAVAPIASADVPARFGFVQRPLQPAGQEECY